MTDFPRRGLYLITPDSDDTHQLLRRVSQVLPFAACLQYRNKRANDECRLAEAAALRELSKTYGVCFIVNDDVWLAHEVAADGVHLGEADSSLQAAREWLGENAIIGISCYDDAERARGAAAQGADYVAFGAVFASATKPGARAAALRLFADTADIAVPKVAIGGITPDNAHQVVAAGADMIAVIGGVFAADNPVAAARRCAAVFD
ncbi:thiamine phosphate synthase [Lysobacteraceae bacterium NML75-0749]|nr:thiamine phosphate synthase [Xanthomonadaceae bacterium NML75-0749]PJK03295.1 thiamine phosphate synthase [Xanthomonadaceae bacterium NML91-0268]